ncbi:hypothetical protein F4776DRAFT_199282 [Hypoxylon sp. NC0597]|nr:hypothetical protein F4776DRAFT_199282 [Hypoxylon sp. NC0597]
MVASVSAKVASAHAFAVFHQKLQNEWKFKAFCGREYYRTEDIVKWMRRTDTNGPANNAGLLLTEAYKQYPHKNHVHNPTSEDITKEDHRCLIVFAILLEIGYGYLIHIFLRHNITDIKLPELPDTERLKESLIRGEVKDIAEFWEAFKKKMWLYYPCPLRLGMQSTFLDADGRWIMPFCKRQRINLKGGTAQVWEVVVPEPLVHEGLAKVVRKPYLDEEHGMCYTFALKSFTQGNSEIFEWEKDAYLALRDKPGMVRFLGEFEIDERDDDGTVVRTYNILLEYGEEDLEEFFASPENHPPNLNQETIEFWRSLAYVAEALDKIHNLQVKREDGRCDSFSGWHCDLKPDNILRVNMKFKLADFGFARFKRMKPGTIPSRELITGGTETYGAPECDIARRDPSKAVSQSIDTWSFGCVLSVSATWVVLGYQGVLAYHELRKIAIAKLRQRQKRGENVTVPVADDAFHNGVDVLPEIKEWHMHIRSLIRKSDTITGLILDLVDEKMLLKESARQSTSELLYPALIERLRDAQVYYDQLVEQRDVSPVTESVKEALLGVEKLGSQPVESRLLYGKDIFLVPQARHQVKSSRVNKSKRMDVIQGKVAHRQDALQPNITKTQGTHSSFMTNGRYPEPSRVRETRFTPGDLKQKLTWPVPSSIPQVASYTSPMTPGTYIEKEAVDSNPFILPSTLAADENPAPSRRENTSGGLRSEEANSIIRAPYDGHLPLGTEPQNPLQLPMPISPQMWNHPNQQFLWPIYQEHQALKSKGKRLARLFKKGHDDYLKNFLVGRDIMFLVDNDTSMNQFWELMTVVLEVLVPNVEAFDKDGLDLEFTIGKGHNVSKTSGSKLMTKFKAAKQEALSRKHLFETDMTGTLTRIFDKYLRGTMGETTLIILTNGVWGGTLDVTSVEKAIANFLKKPGLVEKLAERWFTIQFISFGNETSGILTHLDDEIGKKYSIPDVIDTEPVSGRVYKMILGSIVDTWDKSPSPISLTTPSTPTPLSLPSILSLGRPPSSTSSPIARQNSSRSSKRLSGFKNLLHRDTEGA